MAESTRRQQLLDEIIGGMTPNIRRQQSQLYDYLLQLGQRQGIGSAMQQAARGVAPFAEETAEAAARSGVEATRLAEQREQFEEQLKQREAQFGQQMDLYNRQLAEQQKQNQLRNQMALFEQTGFTPELMESLGYGDLRLGEQRKLQRQIQDLGFKQPGQENGVGAPQYAPRRGLGGFINKARSQFGGRTGLIHGRNF